ncbi:3-oxoacyl-ACP synthase [Prodigiosinella confusarubida]|uniref:3-oxoacyl-ACP synthase n=1 Tax=Serratia sp. (strain ATCC 39006) TaxID=104623 RepID=A0A2I5TLV2_SERS3|nr:MULTISPECIES: 3-oxoacyl-[acyl-carrier-protein] synthase III C-terminal domain-containing protein [Enterobacterales]AUH01217.1 3-oxoacyl-ACP synthase [Serratia sp. ATCC 39006]AUH05538.1 3-oxoacyl-ACP synthase [Serratia sp. ATCC 39006]
MLLNIVDIEVAFAPKIQTIAQAVEQLGLSKIDGKMFERFYGLKQFPHDDDQPLAALIAPALSGIVDRHPDLVGRLKLCVHCHTIPTISPFNDSPLAGLVNHFFGPTTECASYTMSHCATGLVALEQTATLLEEGESAIVLIAEKAFHQWVQLIPATTIMGEAACAVLITRTGRQLNVLQTTTTRDGRFSINSGHRQEHDPTLFQQCYFDFVQHHITTSLTKSGMDMSAIKYLVPHNVNRSSWKEIGKNMMFPADLVFLDNVPRYGHCFGADPFINLMRLIAEGRLAEGDKVMLISVGLGATASSAVIECHLQHWKP